MSARRMSSWAIVAALGAAAVAVAPVGAQGVGQTPQARAVLPGIEGAILLDTMALSFKVSGNRDSIFTALETVFKELKLPVESRNAKSTLLNNLNADISRRLGDVALSRYLDCGRGFSGSNADFYRITLAFSVWVEPATGEPQQLMVAIAASGRDPAGSRSAYSQCTSRGALEKRIADRVQELVGTPR